MLSNKTWLTTLTLARTALCLRLEAGSDKRDQSATSTQAAASTSQEEGFSVEGTQAVEQAFRSEEEAVCSEEDPQQEIRAVVSEEVSSEAGSLSSKAVGVEVSSARVKVRPKEAVVSSVVEANLSHKAVEDCSVEEANLNPKEGVSSVEEAVWANLEEAVQEDSSVAQQEGNHKEVEDSSAEVGLPKVEVYSEVEANQPKEEVGSLVQEEAKFLLKEEACSEEEASQVVWSKEEISQYSTFSRFWQVTSKK